VQLTNRPSAVAVGVAVALLAAAPTATAAPTSSATPVRACSARVPAGYATCFALQSRNGATTATAAAVSGYGPADLRSAYQLTAAARRAGHRVYIIDAFDDPTAEADLSVYRRHFGLPPCTTANGCFRKLNQNGARAPLPRRDTGWAQEESVDLDMVSAICPRCAITLIETKNNAFTNLMAGARKATALGARFVSMSFGAPEFRGEKVFDADLARSGVVYSASTGDTGYGTQYPAASGRVVAVGGTTLKRAANSRGWSETAWRGGGSGCSGAESKPSWQRGIASCGRRAEADVSAVGDPGTGVAVYLTTGGSGWRRFGGTSVAAPIIAAVYALAGTPGSGSSPGAIPYAHRAALFDVTAGSNGKCGRGNLCTAGRGWDGPTGLGTPKGLAAF
jgi:subtilase family serine protease